MKSHAKQTLLLSVTLGLFLYVIADLHAPVVQTALGSLRGGYVSVKGKDSGVHAFLGVPFAEAPVGPALRLAAPQPVKTWEGVKDATQQPPMCIQNKMAIVDLVSKLEGLQMEIPDISEDCLYLNIYTPANRAPDAKLPVMVWIHGGGFTIGSASMFDGSALAAYEDVVVVLIQYRLGLLGFLSTGDENMPGNYGLLDQVEALKWVQQHIHNFGGNPNLVTIFGESAGGMSVSFLLLSPLSKGLFHHAIAESGTAAISELLQNEPLPLTQRIANMSGCGLESTEIISDCMRNLDLKTVVEFAEIKELSYVITVDGHYLMKPVDELYRNQELLTVPFMTGITSDEGGWLLPTFIAPPNWTEGMTREQVKNILSVFHSNTSDIVLDLALDEYTGKSDEPKKIRSAFTEMLGDFIFVVPALKTINAHKDAGAPVYVYEYHFVPHMLKALRPEYVGSDHGDDLFAVFGFCFTTTHVKITESCPKDEEEITKTVMTYWANFARTGSPNGDGLVHWPRYGAEEEYLVIDKEQVVSQHLRKDRFIFLTQTLPEKMQEYSKKDHIEL